MHWGISHEDVARKAYIELIQQDHDNFECSSSGFHVNPQFPHLGASPDGIITCDCCGKGLIEIKCPFKYHNVHDAVHDSSFFLKKVMLKKFNSLQNMITISKFRVSLQYATLNFVILSVGPLKACTVSELLRITSSFFNM